MDWDPCGSGVHWSLVNAASTLSTLAGVLAGFLVVATTALFATFYRTNSNTIALFSVGVPALTTSSFLFAFISGVLPIDKNPGANQVLLMSDEQDTRCFQLWSQWIFAMNLLAVGGAVLICGFAWALIAYTERASEERVVTTRPLDLDRLQARRTFMLRVTGAMSATALITATVILVTATVVYIRAINHRTGHPDLLPDTSNVIILVWGLGIYAMFRVAWLAWFRTRAAVAENEAACKRIKRHLFTNRSQTGKLTRSRMLTLLLLAFTLAAATGARFDWSKGGAQGVTPHSGAVPQNGLDILNFKKLIKAEYKYGRVFHTTFHVVWMVLYSIAFSAAFYQGDLWHERTNAVTYAVLSIGCFYPLLILLGLAYSLASGDPPQWKTFPVIKYIIP
jgi:hypothetical protein